MGVVSCRKLTVSGVHEGQRLQGLVHSSILLMNSSKQAVLDVAVVMLRAKKGSSEICEPIKVCRPKENAFSNALLTKSTGCGKRDEKVTQRKKLSRNQATDTRIE